MLKAREVRDYVKSMGQERGVVYCLETLAEQQKHMMKRIIELANYFDKLVESMDGMVHVTDRMKQEVQRLTSEQEDDLPPNTERLDNDRNN